MHCNVSFQDSGGIDWFILRRVSFRELKKRNPVFGGFVLEGLLMFIAMVITMIHKKESLIL